MVLIHLKKVFLLDNIILSILYLHLERSSLFVCYFKPYFLVHCYFVLIIFLTGIVYNKNSISRGYFVI